MLTKRTNILFDEQVWKELASISRKKEVSIGELVRTAVRKEYMENNRREEVKEAIENIRKFREKYGKLYTGDSVEIIRKMREERTKHLLSLSK